MTRVRYYIKFVICIARSFVVLVTARCLGLPGGKFGFWSLFSSVAFLKRREYDIANRIIQAPVAGLRYYEFDFVDRYSGWRDATRILDVSSPRCLSLYCALHSIKDGMQIDMLNPDPSDIEETKRYAHALSVNDRVKLHNCYLDELINLRKLYDVVWAISVIEHTEAPADHAILKYMQALLLPGGRLCITTVIDAQPWVEYRERSYYGLDMSVCDEGHFFSRWYDVSGLKADIIDVLDEMRLVKCVSYVEKNLDGLIHISSSGWLSGKSISETTL